MIPLFLLFLIVASCSMDDSFYDRLTAYPELPFREEPTVNWFAEENSITLFWTDDPGTDEYILARDVLFTGTFTEIVYQGGAESFVDRGVENNTNYYYRLSKLKDDTVYAESDPVYALATSSRKDRFETNDTKETAYLFSDDMITANTFYFQDDLAVHSASDRDWFAIEIRPQQVVTIRLDIISSGVIDYTNIHIGQEGYAEQSADGDQCFYLYNPLSTIQIVYFYIRPYKESILAGLTGSGGKFLNYSLTYISQTSINI